MTKYADLQTQFYYCETFLILFLYYKIFLYVENLTGKLGSKLREIQSCVEMRRHTSIFEHLPNAILMWEDSCISHIGG